MSQCFLVRQPPVREFCECCVNEYRAEGDKIDVLSGYCGPGRKMDFRAKQNKVSLMPATENLQTNYKAR